MSLVSVNRDKNYYIQYTVSLKTNRLYCYFQNISLLKSYSEVKLKKTQASQGSHTPVKMVSCFSNSTICKYVLVQLIFKGAVWEVTSILLYLPLSLRSSAEPGSELEAPKKCQDNFIKKCYFTIIFTYFDTERFLLLHLNVLIYSYVCYDAILTNTVWAISSYIWSINKPFKTYKGIIWA
jgi:hypothetical protein